MPTHPAELLEQVNSSGFPFQLRVTDEIRQTKSPRRAEGHNWEILSTEHQWTNPGTKETGYIDIVLGMDFCRLILECKRVLDAVWIFTVGKVPDPDVQRVRSLNVFRLVGEKRLCAWKDQDWRPPSYESSISVLWREQKAAPTLLEKVVSHLIDSLECFADEEATLWTQSRVSKSGSYFPSEPMYVPVLVTNAQLQICCFDPNSVNLDRGEISTSDAEFKPVPYIRFRKAMISRYDVFDSAGLSLSAANLGRERTAFVVQASHLFEFLRQFPN
jgi:hypothetical protein